MRNDVKLEKWSVSAENRGWTDDFLESVFFTGNGRMGARGYLSLTPDAPPEKTGLYIAGIFGQLKAGITDFVNLPTPIYAQVEADGRPLKSTEENVRRNLNLHNGLFTAEYTLDCAGKLLRVCEERFFSLCNTGLLVQRITLTPDREMALKISGGIHTACCNLPVADDQTKENTETVQLVSIEQTNISERGLSVQLCTKGTGIEIHEKAAYHINNLEPEGTFQDEQGAGLIFSGAAIPQKSYVLEQCTFITTSRDKDPRIQRQNSQWSFNSLLQANETAWAQRWETANVEIEGADQADAALRYIIFQLIANDSARDSSVSIGARGLTHTRYKGCYFWDTDLFMMPFYLYTDSEAAKNLMQYRADTLPQAKTHARKMNGEGARYPWMASFDGSEQCESWDIGASELHITADVVYALNDYINMTGDMNFYAKGAAEIYVETARFWLSRYTPDSETGGVNLLFCKGPDEYCGITSNNLYTNMLVKQNLVLAQEAAEYLYKHDRSTYQRLNITGEETEKWNRLKNEIKLPKNPVTGHWRQDDTFHLLEPVNISDLKQNDSASYHNVCFDRLQRYRVIKQADVILLMSRFPEKFSPEEKRMAWDDFEPLCLHDSTLSFATHALFAAQNNYSEEAQKYFEKAVLLDLRNVMENTGEEGLHMACFGESWQAAVLGFGGLSFENGEPKLTPRLPQKWKKMSFRFYYHGKQYEASAGQKDASLQML